MYNHNIGIKFGNKIIANSISTILTRNWEGMTVIYTNVCPNPGPGFQTSYIVVVFCVQWLEVRGGC